MTSEDRAAGTNLTDKNIHLATQVADQANHVVTKDAAIATMKKLIHQLQGKIKTLKINQSGQVTKKPDALGYKKVNWWSNP